MLIFRWCVGGVLGLLAGYLSLSVLAVFAYALPRAVSNAARGFVAWNVSRFYLGGALIYSGLLFVVALIAHRLPTYFPGFIVGALLPILPMLLNLKELQADVDERLARAALDPAYKELPSWSKRRKGRA